MTTSKDRDPSLPAIPENSAAKLRSSDWNSEDADDREEQGLFERDNIAPVDDVEEGDVATGSKTTGVNAYPLRNDVGSNIVENGSSDADADDGDGDGSRVDPGPFYVQSAAGDSWELTWPIWHMLPRNDRRDIAAQHGMKSIGEFEEYMSLTRAVDESEGGVEGGASRVVPLASNVNIPESGGQAAHDNLAPRLDDVSDVSDGTWHPPFIGDDEGVDDDSSVSSSEETQPTSDTSSNPVNEAEDIDVENHLERIRLGGLPCSIPDEILHKCFAYLPIDDHASLALVSPHWSRFTRCESLYKILCQRIYLNQSKRKTLHASRFGNSYRKMLELRPRVRTGGGMYVLKYQEVRKIQRDMWTEIPVGAVLESVYYRYLYFFEDGRVMYALTPANPVEMIPRFSKMLLHGYGSKDKWGVWGRYQIKKDVVKIWVSQEWHDVCFQLKVIPSNSVLHYDMGNKGVCTTMQMEKHMSSKSGNFDENSYDLVVYDVPLNGYFRFLKDKRL